MRTVFVTLGLSLTCLAALPRCTSHSCEELATCDVTGTGGTGANGGTDSQGGGGTTEGGGTMADGGGGGGPGGGGGTATGFSAVSAGMDTTCAVTTEGQVMCWGRGDNGELGNGETGTFSATPVTVVGIADAVDVDVSRRVCARRAGGTLSCWGAAPLGDGNDVASSVPQTINLGAPVLDVSTGPTLFGPMHTCAALQNGTKCWGSNMSGQLGANPATTYSPTPNLVGFGGDRVCAGGNFSCSANDTGVVCWGNGEGGQLGNGTNDTTHLTSMVATLVTTTTLTCGFTHVCAIADGTVWCWGGGALGVPGTDTSNVPLEAVGLPLMSDVAAGIAHTCAVSDVGDVWCWGGNLNGQLGTGDMVESQTPVMVQGLSGAEDVATGRGHSCALTSDGRLYCWGQNDFGQLGNNTIEASTTPVEVVLP